MSFLVFLAALLGAIFVWGLLWPRSQWQVLASWTRRNPDASEPGGSAYAVHRILSGIGVATFCTVGVVAAVNYLDSLPAPEPPRTALQQMWGTAPTPVVVDRIVRSGGSADPALPAQTLIGYQVVDNTLLRPRYLAYLGTYTPPGSGVALIGDPPSSGFSALDSAEMVVGLRVKPQCMPVAATVVETEEVVQVSIAAAVATPVGADAVAHDFCGSGSTVGPSLLVPIDLAQPIGEREVQLLDGTALAQIEVIESG